MILKFINRTAWNDLLTDLTADNWRTINKDTYRLLFKDTASLEQASSAVLRLGGLTVDTGHDTVTGLVYIDVLDPSCTYNTKGTL